MVFPTTETMRENPKQALVQVEYECNNESICDFQKAIEQIKTHSTLNNVWHCRDNCVKIAENIAENQKTYLPAVIDGYLIKRMGYDLVYLARKRAANEKQNMTGVIDCSHDSFGFF